MRIDDTDPDELDEPQERGSRRKWWVIGAAVALIGAGVTTFVLTRGGDDDTTAPTTTVAATDSSPDTLPPIVNTVPGEQSFPDYGSDYMGQKLTTLVQRVTDTGIRVTVQDTGDWNQFPVEGAVVNMDPTTGVVIALNGDSTQTVTASTAVAAGDTTAGGEDVPAATLPSAVPIIAPVPVPGPEPTIVGGWTPPSFCNPSGGIRVAMTYKDSIGVSNGSRYTEPRDGLNVIQYSSGYAEDNVFRVLVMQVGDDVLQVTAAWADGLADGAAAVNGWVVLASPGQPNTKFALTVTTATGDKEIPYEQLPREGDAAWQKACSPPPPELPPAGEQPKDPAAAEQQIRDNFDLLWDQEVAFEDKGADLLDDTTGVRDAIDQVFAGSFGEVAKTAVHTMNKVVFTSPTEAWFEYDIASANGNFTGRFGIAYLIDGHWRFARAVICQDLQLAGGQCEPYVDQIVPPGSGGVGIGGGTTRITIEPQPPSS